MLLIPTTLPFFPARTIFEKLPGLSFVRFAPCALMIFIIWSYAFPESKSLRAIAFPRSFRALPQSSRSSPAIIIDFSLSSCGASGSFFRVLRTSIASREGPIPFPIGWSPLLKITLIFIPRLLPRVSNLRLSMRPSFLVLIFTCGPTGMSMRTWFEETENFFAMIDASNIP